MPRRTERPAGVRDTAGCCWCVSEAEIVLRLTTIATLRTEHRITVASLSERMGTPQIDRPFNHILIHGSRNCSKKFDIDSSHWSPQNEGVPSLCAPSGCQYVRSWSAWRRYPHYLLRLSLHILS